MKSRTKAFCLFVLYPVFGLTTVFAGVVSSEPAGYLYSVDEEGRRSAIPLKEAWVGVDVSPGIIETTVSHVFRNDTEETLECAYLFPLPEDAAVVSMELRYGDRVVVSTVEEKAEAKATYDAARASGKRAALLEHHRANLFSTSVASFLPDETVEIRFAYIQELKLHAGGFQYRLPLVSAESYFPPPPRPYPNTLPEALAVAAADTVDYLGKRIARKDVVAGRDASHRLTIDLVAIGLPIDRMYSRSHDVEGSASGGAFGDWSLQTEIGGQALRRDFVVDVALSMQSDLVPTMIAAETETGVYGSLTLFPPQTVSRLDDNPGGRDVIFLIDHSGSMSGERMVSAREGVASCLMQMRGRDRFNIVIFDNDYEFYSDSFIEATPEALALGVEFARSIESAGGTNMQPALSACLDRFEVDSPNEQIVIFLTDGAVGNEVELIGLLQAKLGRSRLFTFGIGTAPNEFLMKQMAAAGRGQSRFIMDDRDVNGVIRSLFQVLDTPVLKDVELTFYDEGFERMEVDALPFPIANVYAGYPVQVVFRCENEIPKFARLSGLRQGEEVQIELNLPSEFRGPKALATLFGQKWIDSLLFDLYATRDLAERQRLEKEIVEVSVLFQLVTPYTSRVAVERRGRRSTSQPLAPYAKVAASGARLVSSSEGEDVFELSPFTVEASPDSGYRAQSAMAGTRLNTSLKDVGAAVTVLTEEFLNDLGATEIEAVRSYASSIDDVGMSGYSSGGGANLSSEMSTQSLGRFSVVEPLALSRVISPGSPAASVSSDLSLAGGAAIWEKGPRLDNQRQWGARFGDQDYSAVWFDANQSLLEGKLAVGAFAARTQRETDRHSLRLGLRGETRPLRRFGLGLAYDSYEDYMSDKRVAGFLEFFEKSPVQYEFHWNETKVEDPYAFGIDRVGSRLAEQLASDGLYPLFHVREQSTFAHGLSSVFGFRAANVQNRVALHLGKRHSTGRLEYRSSGGETLGFDSEATETAVHYSIEDREKRFDWSFSIRDVDYDWQGRQDSDSDTLWHTSLSVRVNEVFSIVSRYAEEQQTPLPMRSGLVFDAFANNWVAGPKLESSESRGFDLFGRFEVFESRLNLEFGYFRRVDLSTFYRDWAAERQLAAWYEELGMEGAVDLVLRNAPQIEQEGVALRFKGSPTRRIDFMGWYVEDFRDDSPLVLGGNRRAAFFGRWVAWDGSWDRLILGGGFRYRNRSRFFDGFEHAGGIAGEVFARYEFGYESRKSFQLNIRGLGGEASRASRFDVDTGAETTLSFRQAF